MKLDKRQKLLIFKEIARLLINGEKLLYIDIVSVFDGSVKTLLNFLNNFDYEFNEEEFEVLNNFFKNNVDMNGGKNGIRKDKNNLTEVYYVMDLKTGEYSVKTTKEDAIFVFESLKNIGVKNITSSLIYQGLRRLKFENYGTLFPLREHILSNMNLTIRMNKTKK